MELRRIVNIRNVFIIVLILLVNVCIFLYGNKDEFYNWRVADDTVKSDKLNQQIKYNSTYSADILHIIDKAERMKSNKLFSDKSGFSYNNIVKTQKDYEKCKDIVLNTEDATFIEIIMDYSIVWVLALVVILYIINQLHTERDNGVWWISYAAKYGRARLAIIRTGIVALVSVVVCMCLYGVTVMIALVGFDGIKALSSPIQNLSTYKLSTIKCNMIEFILLNFLWSYIAVLAIVMVIYTFMSVFRNRKNVILITVALGIIEYLLYENIEPYSKFGVLRNFNIVRLFSMSDICTVYYNVGFSTCVVSRTSVLIGILVAVILVCALIVVASGEILKPQNRFIHLGKVADRIERMHQFILSRCPYAVKEIHKCVFTSKGKWAIIAVLLGAIYFSNYDLKSFSDMENYNDNIYLKYGGEDYSEISALIGEKRTEYKAAHTKLMKLKAGYEAGEVGVVTYLGYAEYCNSLANSTAGMVEVENKINYLNKLKEQYNIEGYLMSDRGYEQMFGKTSIVRTIFINMAILLCVTILAYCNVKNEYKSNMVELIASSEMGKKKLYTRKMIIGGLIAVVTGAVAYGIEYAIMIKHYGIPYVNAPVQSLTFMEECPFDFSIMQYMIILITAKLLVIYLVSVVLYMFFRMYIERRKDY